MPIYGIVMIFNNRKGIKKVLMRLVIRKYKRINANTFFIYGEQSIKQNLAFTLFPVKIKTLGNSLLICLNRQFFIENDYCGYPASQASPAQK